MAYITVTSGLRGYFAVLVEDGEPVQTGFSSFETYEEAAEDAESWALAEDVRADTKRPTDTAR